MRRHLLDAIVGNVDHGDPLPDRCGRLEEAERVAGPDLERLNAEVAAAQTATVGGSVSAHAKAVLDDLSQPFVRNGVRFSSQFRPA